MSGKKLVNGCGTTATITTESQYCLTMVVRIKQAPFEDITEGTV